MSKKKLLSLLLVFIILAVTCGFMFAGKARGDADFFVMLTFFVNIIFSFVQFMSALSEHPFSFRMVFWLFSLFFLSLAPCLQYVTDTYCWGLNPLDREVLIDNLIVLLWFTSFYIGYYAGKKTKSASRIRLRAPKGGTVTVYSLRRGVVLGFALLAVAVGGYLLYSIGGIRNIFFRSTNEEEAGNTIAVLLKTHVLRNFLLFAALFSWFYLKENKKLVIFCIAAMLMFLLCCFPTGIARYMMAAFYGGILINVVSEKFRKGRAISIGLIIGLVIIYPAINVFRNVVSLASGESMSVMLTSSIQDVYLQGHYDAHQMFISITRYVDENGFTYGGQFLGALLFFVPRAIWPDKPIGTGATIITALQQDNFTNVSAPLYGEFYINFGIPGVVILGMIVAAVCARVDKKYWATGESMARIRVLYPFSMLYFFFMLRGDLMSSFAYFTANLVMGTFCHLCYVKKKNYRLKDGADGLKA